MNSDRPMLLMQTDDEFYTVWDYIASRSKVASALVAEIRDVESWFEGSLWAMHWKQASLCEPSQPYE